MYTQWADPEMSQQLLENALLATTWSLIGLAALVAMLCLYFIVAQCARLMADGQARRRSHAARERAAGFGILHGGRPVGRARRAASAGPVAVLLLPGVETQSTQDGTTSS